MEIKNVLTAEAIAAICHDANRAYCILCGDYSQSLWENAPKWQKDSAIDGVNFRINNPDVTSEDMHNNWMKEKLESGWIYGDIKDASRKTHPCIVEYNKLPEFQQKKDYLFSAIVKVFR